MPPGHSISQRIGILLLALSFYVPNVAGQGLRSERSANSTIWSTPAPTATVPEAGSRMRVLPTPQFGPSDQPSASPAAEPLPGEVFLLARANARAALIGDSTRLDPAGGGVFLPSIIPVQGQPFFGSGSRGDSTRQRQLDRFRRCGTHEFRKCRQSAKHAARREPESGRRRYWNKRGHPTGIRAV